MVLLKLTLLAAALLYCRAMRISATIKEVDTTKCTTGEKLIVLAKVNPVKIDEPEDNIVDILKASLSTEEEFGKWSIQFKGPQNLATKVLQSLRSNNTNLFHMLVNGDKIYGGNREELEIMQEIFESFCQRLTSSPRRNGDQKGREPEDHALKTTVSQIRDNIKTFLTTHETTNPYWSNGVAHKFLGEIYASSKNISEKAKAIESFLTRIMTKDQFVVVITQLRSCFNSISDNVVIVNNKPSHTMVVIRTANVSNPYRWWKMEPDNSNMKRMFNCSALNKEEFYHGVEVTGARAGALFSNPYKYKTPETAIININRPGNVNIPGWWMTGAMYANYLKSEFMKEIIFDKFKDCLIVLSQ